MFSFRDPTPSADSVLSAERIAHQALTRELLEKIAQIDADRQRYGEREEALLDLLKTYKNEMIQKFEEFKAAHPSVDAHTSMTPTSIHSVSSYSSPQPSPMRCPTPDPGREAFEQNMTRYILQGAEAARSLLTLSASYSTLSLFRGQSQDGDYETAQTNLYQIPGMASSFACQVADLRQECVKSQDLLVPHVMEWYMTHAKVNLGRFLNKSEAQPAPTHPRELRFNFHGIQEMLAELCKDAWCLGPQSEHCIHKLDQAEEPTDDEITGVIVVHPGCNWDDVKRYLFVGLKGVTTLEGEIFCLVDLAMLRDRWSHEFLTDASWDEAYHYVDEVDVFWVVPDDFAANDQLSEDASSSKDSVAVGVTDSDYQLSEGMSGPVDALVDNYTNPVAQAVELGGDEFSQPELIEESADVFNELALHVQPQDLRIGKGLPQNLTLSHGEYQQPDVPPVQINPHPYLRAGEGLNASTFIREREDNKLNVQTPPTQLGTFTYLKAGEGINASRSPSFIQNREDDKLIKLPPPVPLGPYPYLKAGEGLRRRSQPPMGTKKWK